MIKSFGDKETEKIFNREWSSILPNEIQRSAVRKLWMISKAKELKDLKNPPGNRLEKLRDKRSGQYSIRINDQWRICFKWRAGDVYELKIVDYH
jgi:toxin HigB-1